MEDISVGDYVRTDSGEIFKVIDVEKGSVKIKSNYKEWIGICCIKKHSKQLIDLIESGDYVNGYKVINVFDNSILIDNFAMGKLIYSYEIKSIVTKECFQSVSYEV